MKIYTLVCNINFLVTGNARDGSDTGQPKNIYNIKNGDGEILCSEKSEQQWMYEEWCEAAWIQINYCIHLDAKPNFKNSL